MGKSRTSGSEWARRVIAWRASGETAEVFASRHGWNPLSLRWYGSGANVRREQARREARKRERLAHGKAGATRAGKVAPTFVELPSSVVGDDRFEIDLGHGRQLRVPPSFDVASLRRLLAALDER